MKSSACYIFLDMNKKLIIFIFLLEISCTKKNTVAIEPNNVAQTQSANKDLVIKNSIISPVPDALKLQLNFSLIPNQSSFVNEAKKILFTIENTGENFNCEQSLKASSSDLSLVPIDHIVFSGKGRLCFAEIIPGFNKLGSATITFEFLQNSKSKMTFLFEITQKITKTNIPAAEKPKQNSPDQPDFKSFIQANKAQTETQDELPVSNILSSVKNEQPVFKNIENKPGDPKPANQDGIKKFLHSARDLKK